MIEINTTLLEKYKARRKVWVPPSRGRKGYHRMQETGIEVNVGPADWKPTPEEIEDQAYGFPIKVPSDPKKEWRDKASGYFSCDKASPMRVKFDPTISEEASVRGTVSDQTIHLGNKFFALDRDHQERIMVHETGHTFEDQISNMETELIGGVAAKVLGTTISRPGKLPYYDGAWGQMNPSEAFADSVEALYNSPDEFKERYPEAYDFMVSVMPPNWKEIIKTNIVGIDNAMKNYK